MNLLQVETFLAVARTASFTRAAALVHRSQSAVSRQIQDLEHSLGVRLFERLGGRVFLTTAGRALRDEAPRLLRQVESIRQRLRDVGQGNGGDLRLGATVTAANTFLPRALVRYRAANPSVTLNMMVDNSPALLERLLGNEIDLAVVTSAAVQTDLTIDARVRDELVLIAAPGHPLANAKRLRPAQLEGVEFIFREAGSDTRALVQAWLTKRRVTVRPLMALW